MKLRKPPFTFCKICRGQRFCRLFLPALFPLLQVLQQFFPVTAGGVLGFVLAKMIVDGPFENVGHILLTDIVVGVVVWILVELTLVLHLRAVEVLVLQAAGKPPTFPARTSAIAWLIAM